MDEKTMDLTITYVPSGRNGVATLTATLGDEVLAVESLNLTKGESRESFTKIVCNERPGIDPKAVETELLRMAAEVANKPDNPLVETSSSDDSAVALAAMPQAVREEAEAMLKAPDLMHRIVADIGLLGVAGEKELATTIYLVGVSRLLTKPLAAIVQGPSSSGKSYLIEMVTALAPPEAVVNATQMTPQALFHMEPGSLEHRFVVAGERSRVENDETAEATRALREMLSSGRLVKLMPMKVNGGEIQTVRIQQDGPISYVESTTLNKLFNEDANRCILLTTDERPLQTRRIITTLAANYTGSRPENKAQQIVTRHHALQRMLQPYSVVVPFADRLGELVADDRVEARRAFPQLMSMVQAVALLHQRQRKIDDDGRLLAAPDDYLLAHRLLSKPMERLLGGRLSDPAQRFLSRLREHFPVEKTFTTLDAVKRETGCRSSVYGWLSELHDAGLVNQIEAKRGRAPAIWKLPVESAIIEPIAALPSTEQLFGNQLGHMDTNEKP